MEDDLQEKTFGRIRLANTHLCAVPAEFLGVTIFLCLLSSRLVSVSICVELECIGAAEDEVCLERGRRDVWKSRLFEGARI